MSSQAPNPYAITPLTEEQTLQVEAEIERHREALLDELGNFRQERLPTGRVLLVPDIELPHVCYMSDNGPDARLCVDDYVPELANRDLDPNRPSDTQEGG